MLSSLDKILIIGLGQLGLPVAKYLKERGFNTYGYDIKSDALDYAKRKYQIKQTADFGSEDFQVFIVSVSTNQANDISSPEIDGLLSVAEKISKEAKSVGALVTIESTVPKGTSKKVFEILNHRLHVVHVPHRWYGLEERNME